MIDWLIDWLIDWVDVIVESLQVKLLVDIFSNGANAKSCAFEKKNTDGADVLHIFLALKEVKDN